VLLMLVLRPGPRLLLLLLVVVVLLLGVQVLLLQVVCQNRLHPGCACACAA
jgi:hypothetical protein